MKTGDGPKRWQGIGKGHKKKYLGKKMERQQISGMKPLAMKKLSSD